MNGFTQRGERIEFVKEHLTFTGDDSPMANLMLSVMGAFAEFERVLIRERQREGIALARQRGAYRGRKKALAQEQFSRVHYTSSYSRGAFRLDFGGIPLSAPSLRPTSYESKIIYHANPLIEDTPRALTGLGSQAATRPRGSGSLAAARWERA